VIPEGAGREGWQQAPDQREIKMRKTIPTILGATLLVASTAPFAAATEHHRARKVYRTPAPVSETLRNSNASFDARPTAWPRPGATVPYDEALSPPAGH
jgi:hypothetical protein